MLQIALAIKGFQRVAGVKLPCAEKRFKHKTVAVRLIKQPGNEAGVVAFEHILIVIAFAYEIRQTRVGVGKRHRAWRHMRGHKRRHRLAVFLKLDTSVGVVKVEHRVQRVIVRRRLPHGVAG